MPAAGEMSRAPEGTCIPPRSLTMEFKPSVQDLTVFFPVLWPDGWGSSKWWPQVDVLLILHGQVDFLAHSLPVNMLCVLQGRPAVLLVLFLFNGPHMRGVV